MFDTLILGSGPAGLSAAIYATRAKLNCKVIEKEPDGTGQISETGLVDNYPGIPNISGFNLGKMLREHAGSLGSSFHYGEVTRIAASKDENGHDCFTVELNCDKNHPLTTRTVLYAMGAEHVRLDIAGEENLIGCGICFCAVCDGPFFEGLTVAVIGGGNSALGDALHMAGIAEKVYLIHRRDTFRASASLVDRVKSTANIELVLNAEPIAFEGSDDLEAILLADGRRIAVQGAFEAVGMTPRSALVKDIVRCDKRGYIEADENGITSLPGFFAAGDVRTKKLRQAITAAADGAASIQSIVEYLRDN